MPELDFLLIGDHVRAEGGVYNILAAGVDRIFAEVPSLIGLGIVARLAMTEEETESAYTVDLKIAGPDGSVLLQLRGELGRAAVLPDLPEGWPRYAGIALNLSIPLMAHGIHTLTLILDGRELKTVGLIVEPPQEA